MQGDAIHLASIAVVLLYRRQMLQLLLGTSLGAAAIPSLAKPQPPLRIGLISDLNGSYGSTSYVPAVHQGLHQLIALQPNLVVCAGDMVAGQKHGLTRQQLDAMWSSFEATVLTRCELLAFLCFPPSAITMAHRDLRLIATLHVDFGCQSAHK